MKTYTYVVSMLGYTSVRGELRAATAQDAAGQAVLLFEQENDIDPKGVTLADRIKYFAPKIAPKAGAA